MKIGLGKLIEIDFKFWLKSNDYYSDKKMTANVKTGFNHVSKAGLIRKYKENLKTNQDLINLIKQKIKQKNNPDFYSDIDLLTIFDLIQAWGGPMGRGPYVQPKANPSRKNQEKLYAQTYRRAVEMLYEIDKDNYVYEKNILPIKDKIEELKRVGESFSTKHLSFWSRSLDNCPNLVIYDTRMREIIRAANKNIKDDKIPYKNFIDALLKGKEVLKLEIHEIERAIFAFSSNYFKNKECTSKNLNKKFKTLKDKEIAMELVS